MPIPARARPPQVSDELIEKLSPLCDAIEDGRHREDLPELLAEWHRYAQRMMEQVEFAKYYGAMDKEDFIREAVTPPPKFIADLTYTELKDVLHAVCQAEAESEAELSYLMSWLEVNLPGSRISDLINWPNEWFGDEAAFRDKNGHFKPESELSDEQILRYAMLKSGRMLADAPANVVLPFPIPK